MLPSIVLVIVDGMGPATMEAARIVEYGNSNSSVINYFDAVRPVSTQNVDNNLTDSAAGGTAISTGHRTNNYKLGIDENNVPLQNIIEYLRVNHPEYVTGVIAKVYAGHATPASFLTHTGDRNSIEAIYQSILDYSKADLIIGSGYYNLKPFEEKFKKQGYNTIIPSHFNVEKNVFQNTKLPMIAAMNDKKNIPFFMDEPQSTLINITKQAIKVLNETGPFFLMVECSLVDGGGHYNNATMLVGDMIEADILLRELIEMKDVKTIVIADHETGGVTITGDLKGLENIPLPREANGSEAHKIRQKRIDQLGIKFSTTQHSNSYVTFGAHGFGPVSWVKTTSDVRRFINLYLDGVEPTPYDGCVKNEAENIFKNRFYYKPAEEKEKMNKTGKVVVGITIGIASVLGAVGIVWFVYMIIKRSKKGKFVQMKTDNERIQVATVE
ncbi:Alkaline_phosphatase [Hexamita inflata]|uniref:alkaline phosphatase n=1 Tax=Hexamita inflata TaxID=28002 RepID=A0AA86NWX9_9EUKA|nr:Alkaline phosphatase [Hexamita inflata]